MNSIKYHTLKIPLKKIISKNFKLNIFIDSIKRTNKIVFYTYFLLRIWILKKYYSKDDLVMYKQIEKTCLDISNGLNLKIIPSGNFIQFLRGFDEFNCQIKDSIPLSRDRRHMHELFGRYALSLLWAHTLFSVDLSLCKFYPNDISDKNKSIIDRIKDLFSQFIYKEN